MRRHASIQGYPHRVNSLWAEIGTSWISLLVKPDALYTLAMYRHSQKKTPAQLQREIAVVISQRRQPPRALRDATDLHEELTSGESAFSLKDRSSGSLIRLKVRAGRVVGAMGSEPKRYIGLTLDEAKHLARYGGMRVSTAQRSKH